MRIVWVTRSFLDYRIPVYNAISSLADHDFFLIFGDEAHINPPRVVQKAKDSLGERAIALKGEKRIGQPYNPAKQANSIIRIFYQPGLGRIIRSLKPDVIITDAFNHWTLPVFRIRILHGIKHVMCYERTKHTERDTLWVKNFIRKRTFKWIDHIVCNGLLCAAYVEWLGYPRSRISQGNMAADSIALQQKAKGFDLLKRKKLKEKLGLHKYVYLFLGRIVNIKGLNKLIDAWDKSMATNDQSSLLIVGDGPDFGGLKEHARLLKSTNVRFIGAVDYDFVYQYYSIANIFIIPTLQDNWSLVVPEAMSVGLPIISSKYNGCWPELVKPENGWVFDPLDQDNFVSILMESWEKRNCWKEMGKKSLEIVQDYTPEKVAQNIYSACLTVTRAYSDRNE